MSMHVKYLASAGSGTQYNLTMKNEAAQSWTFYVYQKAPELSSDVFSLAWFASPYEIRPGNKISFTWEIDYDFVWSDTGTLIPGVTFEASGSQPCSPAGDNTTDFNLVDGPGLSTPTQGDPAGSLVINDGSDVPNNQFSVGIGMSGTGTYAVQAGANLQHIFTPTPSYYVAAGTNVKIGTVLNIDTITQNKEVKYGANVYEVTATLNESNVWDLS